MLSISLWVWYINITITILHIIHRPVFHLKLNSTQLYRFVRTSQETDTSLLRAQQVKAIYKFATMVC
jgi:hypothetical protein